MRQGKLTTAVLTAAVTNMVSQNFVDGLGLPDKPVQRMLTPYDTERLAKAQAKRERRSKRKQACR
jgi:hypothetical protein